MILTDTALLILTDTAHPTDQVARGHLQALSSALKCSTEFQIKVPSGQKKENVKKGQKESKQPYQTQEMALSELVQCPLRAQRAYRDDFTPSLSQRLRPRSSAAAPTRSTPFTIFAFDVLSITHLLPAFPGLHRTA